MSFPLAILYSPKPELLVLLPSLHDTFVLLMIWLAIVILCYLIGSFPSGYLVGKSQGIDIRQHGSGNIGATNVLRVMGKKWGYLVFFCDSLKGFISVKVGVWLALSAGGTPPLPECWQEFVVLSAITIPFGSILKAGKGLPHR